MTSTVSNTFDRLKFNWSDQSTIKTKQDRKKNGNKLPTTLLLLNWFVAPSPIAVENYMLLGYTIYVWPKIIYRYLRYIYIFFVVPVQAKHR